MVNGRFQAMNLIVPISALGRNPSLFLSSIFPERRTCLNWATSMAITQAHGNLSATQ